MRSLIGEYGHAFISGDPKACDLATSIARYPQLKLRVFSFKSLTQTTKRAKGVTKMSQVTGAQSLVNSLEAAGVDVMFGIPGGAILPAYDPIFDSKIRHILVGNLLS